MRNDLVSVRPSVQLRRVNQPWWIVRSIQNDISSEFAWNYDRDNLVKKVQLSSTITFLNYYSLFVGGFHSFPSMDDRSTRGGPLLKNLAASGVWCGVMTDARESMYGSSTLSFSWSKTGTWSNSYQLSGHLRPSSTLTLSVSTGYTTRFTDAQWLANIDLDTDGTFEHSLFGELKEHILDLTLRADMAFTPTLSVQLYVQPYVAVGDYLKIKELAKPASYEFLPFDLGFEPDYNWKSLRGNLVLRWEYYPGSVVYLVWSQDRVDESDPGDFSPGRDLSSLFGASGKDILLLKLKHRFSL